MQSLYSCSTVPLLPAPSYICPFHICKSNKPHCSQMTGLWKTKDLFKNNTGICKERYSPSVAASKLHRVSAETSPAPHGPATLWMKLGLSRNLAPAPEAAAKRIFLHLPQMICLRWGTFPVIQKLHRGSWEECTSVWK